MRRALLLAFALLALGVSSAHSGEHPRAGGDAGAGAARQRLAGADPRLAGARLRRRSRWRSASTAPTCAGRSRRCRPSAPRSRRRSSARTPRRAPMTRRASRSPARRPGRRSPLPATVLALRATERGDAAEAARWLLVREFRPPTKLSRPGSDATLANVQLAAGARSPAKAAAALRADLLDTYQSRLRDALGAVAPALANELPITAAQQAALAEGFWRVLAPSYRAQVGVAQEAAIAGGLAALTRAARAGRTAEVATLVALALAAPRRLPRRAALGPGAAPPRQPGAHVHAARLGRVRPRRLRRPRPARLRDPGGDHVPDGCAERVPRHRADAAQARRRRRRAASRARWSSSGTISRRPRAASTWPTRRC